MHDVVADRCNLLQPLDEYRPIEPDTEQRPARWIFEQADIFAHGEVSSAFYLTVVITVELGRLNGLDRHTGVDELPKSILDLAEK